MKTDLFKALAGFQSEVPVIHKATSGYGYTYADLPDIIEIITPLLQKYELGFTQIVNGNELQTIVFHYPSGQSIEGSATIAPADFKGMNNYQALGSAITYLRRYSLSAMLGLVTDKDVDAADIKPKTEAAKPAQPKPAQPKVENKWVFDGCEYTHTELTKELKDSGKFPKYEQLDNGVFDELLAFTYCLDLIKEGKLELIKDHNKNISEINVNALRVIAKTKDHEFLKLRP